MKISEMLVREDFYTILEQTLSDNRETIHAMEAPISVTDASNDCTLFVNAQLNSIMTAHPSRDVVDYLKTEYNVSGGLLRRLMVRGYLTAATTFVKRFVQKGIKINFKTGVDKDNILIYPCNKKIRLFDFGKGMVYTMLKRDFPPLYIDRETKFRLEHKAPFIPEIAESGAGCYSEKIINGMPVARINDQAFVNRCKEQAYNLVISLTRSDNQVLAVDYMQELKNTCLEQLKQKKAFADSAIVACLFDTLLAVKPDEKLSLVVSHGDFQPGNIWWDKDKKQIVIIDWETVKLRSRSYDHAALYYNLRREGTEQQVIDSIKASSHIHSFIPMCSPESVAKIVMAEELAYQTEELISFPGDIGIKQYNKIIEKFKTLKI
nr:phosphotransferase [uncultured Bacteroides sp.]